MSQKLLEAVARNTRFRLINLLKRTQGLSVQDIADRMGMSYMGVKEVCLDLEKSGLLDGRREPKPEGTTGRPRLVYRLTGRAHELFPTASNPMTLDLLEGAKRLYGPAAPEKLLHTLWQQKGQEWASRVAGESVLARAASLARIRDERGHMAVVEHEEGAADGAIVEHHCPFLDVLRAYPLVAKLEVELFQKLLGVPVRREELQAGGLLRVEFRFAVAEV